MNNLSDYQENRIRELEAIQEGILDQRDKLRARIETLEKVIFDIQDSMIGYEPEHAASCCQHIASIIVNFYKRKDGAE